jgi:hypothetical protein
MGIKLRISADNEHDFRRYLTRLAAPYLADVVETFDPDSSGDDVTIGDLPSTNPDTEKRQTGPGAPETPAPKKPTGRPKGSTNKKPNGSGAPQTEAQSEPPPAQTADQAWLPLAQQVQLITEAVRVDRAKFSPLLPALRKEIGVDLIAKAEEKHRSVLQAFIDTHGLAV